MTKKKTKSKKGNVTLKEIPRNIRECIDCALIFEQVIGRTVLDLREVYPNHNTQSAGLALAIASLTHPESKRFASMVKDVTKDAILDYQKIKTKLLESLSVGNQFLH